jgi:uncharacterized membrane protein
MFNLNPDTLHKRQYLYMAIIIAAGLALRLYRLDFQSLWVDEIASMMESSPELGLTGVIDACKLDQPPASFLLMNIWFKLFGYSDFQGRLFSVVIGILGIMSMYVLGKELRGNAVGLIAALITALTHIHILFSQEARFYTLLFLLSALSFLFYIRAVKFIRPVDFLLYALSTAALLYTHYFGLVVFASQAMLFVGLVLFYPRQQRFILLAFGAWIAVVLMISPWLPIIFSDLKTPAFWIKQESLFFPIVYFYVYFKDILACSVFALLIIYYFVQTGKSWRAGTKPTQAEFILIGWPVFTFLIPLVYSIIRIPMLQVRYTLIALPAIVVIIAAGFMLLKPRLRSYLLVACCFTMVISLVFIEHFYTKQRKEDWRGMISKVSSTALPGDVFVTNYTSYCNYYLKVLHSPHRAIEPPQVDLAKNTPTGVWWLDGFDVKPGKSQFENLLESKGYVQVRVDSFLRAKAVLYKYQTPN